MGLRPLMTVEFARAH